MEPIEAVNPQCLPASVALSAAHEADSLASPPPYAASLESIQAAAARIAPYAHVTPVLTSSSVDEAQGRKLYFKCEVFQKGGAFKFRGACNSVFSLSEDAAAKGVLTHSSGNHAAALALAARLRGVPAYIVVPNTAPQCKVEAVRRYGGQVSFCEPTTSAREAAAAELHARTGAVLIHPYNDSRTISGQGTIALEFLEQVPALDALIVPISGGGMISGIAVAAKALKPSIRVFAAEPRGADDAAQSKAVGRLLGGVSAPRTIADGLRACLGDLTWPIVRDLVDAVIVVEEDEIIAAMKVIYEQLKVVVEPSGAVGLAAAMSQGFREDAQWASCQHVGVVLCGGNVDLQVLWDYFKKQTQ